MLLGIFIAICIGIMVFDIINDEEFKKKLEKVEE